MLLNSIKNKANYTSIIEQKTKDKNKYLQGNKHIKKSLNILTPHNVNKLVSINILISTVYTSNIKLASNKRLNGVHTKLPK